MTIDDFKYAIGQPKGYTKLSEVQLFREYCTIGQRLNCMVFEKDEGVKRPAEEKKTTCRLLKKGRHTAQTTKGTMQWTLLTIWNKRLLEDFKEEARRLRKEKEFYENGLYLQPVQGEG